MPERGLAANPCPAVTLKTAWFRADHRPHPECHPGNLGAGYETTCRVTPIDRRFSSPGSGYRREQ